LAQWYLVKLELAPTEDFPNGSPARAFLLRLPITTDGSIDENERSAHPGAAFARRFWQNEPDGTGVIRLNSAGWFIAFPDDGMEFRYHLDNLKIRLGETVALTTPEGKNLPFRVVSLRAD